MTAGLAVFATTIGHCGIVWDDEGTVVGSTLPEGTDERTLARLRQRFPDAVEQPPPPSVAAAVDALTTLLRDGGAGDALADVPLALESVPPFHRRVYELARTIPAGQTLTYGEVAARLDEPGAARAVGQALGANPFAPIVPCHRILAAGGKSGGFSAHGGTATKQRILEIEGCYLEQPTLFDVTPGGDATA